MRQAGIDVLYVTDPANMAWLTGYDGWSFYVHQGVLIHDAGDPIWFGREMDAAGAKRTVFMDEDNIVGYADHLVQNPERHPIEELAGIAGMNSLGNRRIGVEMDAYYFSARCYEKLTGVFPAENIVDASNLVNWLRIVKSPEEIRYMRIAAEIVDRMHARIFELIEPGMPKNQLVAEIYRTAIKGFDGFGGDYPAIVPMLPSGIDASAPHLTWDDSPFEADTGTFFEIAGCFRRYHCPLSRTVFLGRPPKKFLDAEKIILEGTEAALDAAKAGNSCEQVERAWNRVISRYGITKDSRCGYSIGMAYPPDWGEHTASLRRNDKTLLKENMTFHFIPALWFDDWGIEISESILIGPRGAEPFCRTPRQLHIKAA